LSRIFSASCSIRSTASSLSGTVTTPAAKAIEMTIASRVQHQAGDRQRLADLQKSLHGIRSLGTCRLG